MAGIRKHNSGRQAKYALCHLFGFFFLGATYGLFANFAVSAVKRTTTVFNLANTFNCCKMWTCQITCVTCQTDTFDSLNFRVTNLQYLGRCGANIRTNICELGIILLLNFRKQNLNRMLDERMPQLFHSNVMSQTAF